jgi:hypothetical protein
MARLVSDSGVVETEPAVAAPARGADALNMVGRFVALVAAASLTIVGLIALAKFDWNGQGLDAAAVSVAGMVFRPWVAIATVGLGVLAMLAAVSWDRESKLFMGAILVAVGIAILAATPTIEGIVLTNRMGWWAIIVGGVLAVVGVISGQTWASRRVGRTNTATYA